VPVCLCRPVLYIRHYVWPAVSNNRNCRISWITIWIVTWFDHVSCYVTRTENSAWATNCPSVRTENNINADRPRTWCLRTRIIRRREICGSAYLWLWLAPYRSPLPAFTRLQYITLGAGAVITHTRIRPKHCWLSPFLLVAVLTIPLICVLNRRRFSILQCCNIRQEIGNPDPDPASNVTQRNCYYRSHKTDTHTHTHTHSKLSVNNKKNVTTALCRGNHICELPDLYLKLYTYNKMFIHKINTKTLLAAQN